MSMTWGVLLKSQKVNATITKQVKNILSVILTNLSLRLCDKNVILSGGFKMDYNGMIIYCPYCGEEITIEFNTARCEECGWSAIDADLDEIMNP